MRYKGIIFDLDGVICSTDNTIIKHGKPWQIVWAFPLTGNGTTCSGASAAWPALRLFWKKQTEPTVTRKKQLLLKKRIYSIANCWAACLLRICRMM